MKPALRRLAVGVLAVATGVASAWLVLRQSRELGAGVGPWRYSHVVGHADADLYTRAAVAVAALLALNRSETLYYLATTDSAGQPLRSRCRYRIAGIAPSARWWSLSAYAEDLLLFPDDAGRYGVHGGNAGVDAAGRFVVHTGPGPDDGPTPWVATPGDRGLVFALRLYNPAAALATDPSRLEPPRIEPVGACR